MTDTPRILIASAGSADAQMLAKFLRDDFDHVETTCHPETMVDDFERVEPHVLILAFRTLEEAERYYLGLYRLGARVHAIEHQTVILCHRDSLNRVVALCRKEYFDDYVLFWPTTTDPFRLNMAVFQAVRRLQARSGEGPSNSEFALQARQLAELESVLQENLHHGESQIAQVNAALRQVEAGVGKALTEFSRRCVEGEASDVIEVKNPAAFSAEVSRLKEEGIAKPLSQVSALMQPMQEWVGKFNEGIGPHLATARNLGALAAKVKPKVLFIDDDEFQHRMVARMLEDDDLELHFAANATDALKVLRTLRPDVILMDFNLPEVSGIELTRRIKIAPQFARIPIVMVTGTSAKKVVVESLNAGACDFILKPFERQRLHTRIAKHVGKRVAPAPAPDPGSTPLAE